MPTRMILDCDTGTDDAIAIMLAALHPDAELLGVTTVWGNHDLVTCTDNTLRVLDHIGHQGVPVVPGRAEPLEPRPVPYDDRSLPSLSLPVTGLLPAADDAVEWLVAVLRDTSEPVTLVPTGPLTNIAAAVHADPGIVQAVAEVVLMGGAHAHGNVTPYAERNIWNDAAAAAVVLRAGFEGLVMITLDATHQAGLSATQADELAGLGTPAGVAAARFVRERIAHHHRDQQPATAPVHDPLAVAYLLDPAVVGLRKAHVTVETADPTTYGRTLVEPDSPVANALVAMSAERARFFEQLVTTFRPSDALA